MKTKTLLIAAVMFFGLTAAAFAQATYSVGSIPVTAVINTGLTEKTGDITFTQVSGITAALGGTITISYGVPITIPFSTVTVTAPVGSAYVPFLPVGGTGTLKINTDASNNQAGLLVINVPPGVATGGSDSFTISGVRVAVAGTTLTSLSASISATGNAVTAGQTNVLVIASIAPGIASLSTSLWAGTTIPFLSPALTPVAGFGKISGTSGQTATQTFLSSTGQQTVAALPVIVVKEGFLNAFNDIYSTNGGTGLRFTLSALPPPGVTITFPFTATTDAGTVFTRFASDRTTVTTSLNITSDSSSTSVYYRITSGGDPTKVETLYVPVSFTYDTSKETVPLPIQTINFTTTLWPTGTAFDTDGSVFTTASRIPRYQETLIGPIPLVQIVASTTTLLVPFATSVAASSFDTGFAIANTTEDAGASSGFLSPTAQSGTLTFYFFPQLPPSGTNPANFTYTTAAGSPGTGLDSTGKLPAGSTYTVVLTQLLRAANQPIDFTGYVFIVANFTNAHALYQIYQYPLGGFSQGSLALVVTGDRNLPSGLAEGLNN